MSLFISSFPIFNFIIISFFISLFSLNSIIGYFNKDPKLFSFLFFPQPLWIPITLNVSNNIIGPPELPTSVEHVCSISYSLISSIFP